MFSKAENPQKKKVSKKNENSNFNRQKLRFSKIITKKIFFKTQANMLKLKICDQLSMLVKVYNNKNEYCSEIKIPEKTKYTWL